MREFGVLGMGATELRLYLERLAILEAIGSGRGEILSPVAEERDATLRGVDQTLEASLADVGSRSEQPVDRLCGRPLLLTLTGFAACVAYRWLGRFLHQRAAPAS